MNQPLLPLLLILSVPASAQVITAPVRSAGVPVVPVAPARLPGAGAPTLSAPALSLGQPTLPNAILPSVSAVATPRAAAALAASGRRQEAAAAVLARPAAMMNAAAPQDGAAPLGEQAKDLSRQLASGEKAATLDDFFDGTKAMSRPPFEAWTAGGARYESTARLVKELPDSPEPVPASYEFSRFDAVSRRERLANAGIGGVTGAVAGGVGGTLLALLGSAAGAFLGLFLFGDPTGGIALGEAGIITLFMAGAGALMGLHIGWQEGAKPWRGWVSGEIFRHNGRLLFRTGGASKLTVDLEAYAAAERAPAPPAVAPWPLWLRAAAGTAAGLVVALANAFPLIQIIGIWVAGPAAGAMVGQALSARGEVKGGVLGGALGALLPVTMFAVLAAAPYGAQLAWLGWWVLAVTGLGTVMGAVLGNPIRRGMARRDAELPPGQWWMKGGS